MYCTNFHYTNGVSDISWTFSGVTTPDRSVNWTFSGGRLSIICFFFSFVLVVVLGITSAGIVLSGWVKLNSVFELSTLENIFDLSKVSYKGVFEL